MLKVKKTEKHAERRGESSEQGQERDFLNTNRTNHNINDDWTSYELTIDLRLRLLDDSGADERGLGNSRKT